MMSDSMRLKLWPAAITKWCLEICSPFAGGQIESDPDFGDTFPAATIILHQVYNVMFETKERTVFIVEVFNVPASSWNGY